MNEANMGLLQKHGNCLQHSKTTIHHKFLEAKKRKYMILIILVVSLYYFQQVTELFEQKFIGIFFKSKYLHRSVNTSWIVWILEETIKTESIYQFMYILHICIYTCVCLYEKHSLNFWSHQDGSRQLVQQKNRVPNKLDKYSP